MRNELAKLSSIVDQIGNWQNPDGSIELRFCSAAREVLREVPAIVSDVCSEIGQEKTARCIKEDISVWNEVGLDTPPSFANTVTGFQAPRHGDLSFFWGPLRLANAGKRRGYYLRSFLCQCDEPKELDKIAQIFPHPKNVCHPTHLLWGSKEIVNGNNVVFFPENIANTRPVSSQKYAAFFFNKHYRLYRDITLETAKKICTTDFNFFTENLNQRETYVARCVWGYIHDYFHHSGDRPFDKNVVVKNMTYSGLLEEIKVDLQTYLACRKYELPYTKEVAEFVILERLFRYPQESDYETNFDSGTGLYSLSYFLKNEAIKVHAGRFHFEDDFDSAVSALVSEIQDLEKVSDDTQYLKMAKKKVQEYLPIQEENGNFLVPEIIKTTPLMPFIGVGPTVKNLHSRGGLDLTSQYWAAFNIPESVVHNSMPLCELAQEPEFTYNGRELALDGITLVFSARVKGVSEVLAVNSSQEIAAAIQRSSGVEIRQVLNRAMTDISLA